MKEDIAISKPRQHHDIHIVHRTAAEFLQFVRSTPPDHAAPQSFGSLVPIWRFTRMLCFAASSFTPEVRDARLRMSATSVWTCALPSTLSFATDHASKCHALCEHGQQSFMRLLCSALSTLFRQRLMCLCSLFTLDQYATTSTVACSVFGVSGSRRHCITQQRPPDLSNSLRPK